MENLERIIAELNARDRIRQKGREEKALGVVWFGTVRLRRIGGRSSSVWFGQANALHVFYWLD